VIVKKAYTCYVENDMGVKLIDTTMGSGAQIIGHNNPLIKKIGKQIKRGTIYSIPNYHTNIVNSFLKEYINPDFDEEYIFCNSGTEANMRAIRLARAYTGKNLVGRFHGGWHGGLDGFLEEHPNSTGIPPETNDLFEVLPYNDDRCFEKITSDMAAVIIEPVQGSNPRSDIKQFLKKLRAHCNKVGVLLIFDEVMTGFRLSAKGGAGIFDVRPDIATYGKVLGGGFPIGALGAKSEIIKTKNVFYGGTFSANPLSMYAAQLILKTIINKEYIQYDKINYVGELFRDELNSFFIERGIKMRASGCGSMNRIIFTDKFIKNRRDRDKFEYKNAQQMFCNKLKELGVYVNGNGLYHFSMAHTPDVIRSLVAITKEACNQNT
jgi:glutamate-1-semialdehyde 2,1-aminomutase